MFITKECDYAIRIVRALADGSKRTVKAIAEEEKIPTKFAHNITTKLERAQYVKSYSGRTGGVRLLRPLNSFTLVDIIKAVDDNRCVSDCLSKNSKCTYVKETGKQCAIHLELARIQSVLNDTMSAKTMDVVLRDSIQPIEQAV